MSLRQEHEIHTRRKGRNLGVGLMLGAFVVLVMLLTYVKITQLDFQLPEAPGTATEEPEPLMSLSGPQKTVMQTVGVVIVMGGLAWASVPFYDWFCRVTGFGGVTGVSEAGSEEILDQTIKIRFDGSLNGDMAWEFKPVVREMEIRIGETGLAFYEAYNPTDRPIAGQASYNVTPYQAGGFFEKIDCFCFVEQVLAPGERVEMPVSFFVDPEIVDDRDGKFVHTITLSYTFYEIDLPEGYAALDQGTTTDLN